MLKTIESIKERLIASYDPDTIILYGSHARDESSDKSDIDILISIGSPFIEEIIETGKVIYEKKGLLPLAELLK
ncbi:MAG: nucleotidyltransferase domain-containing protein [Nitrospinae bacterium]|nr:nucleotidyltransferase domain-containing protein [Nitrospinota bacterium]